MGNVGKNGHRRGGGTPAVGVVEKRLVIVCYSYKTLIGCTR